MKEIGSFIELELPKGREYYKGKKHIARLNTGRAAIWHACRITRAKSIWIPYYQCESVRDFLQRKGCVVKYYHQNSHFEPIDLDAKQDEAVLLVNYFGIMSNSRMKQLASSFPNVIIDNCQAFFSKPIEDVLNVYSARKFVGVADGSYVIGENAHAYIEEYPICYSSDTASFLLKRIEYGCEGKGYESRKVNEARVDAEDIMRMSKLTHVMLDAADYKNNRKKRKENFMTACSLFSNINMIDPTRFYDNDTIPMVYPLVVENDNLLDILLTAKHFQGHWWKYIRNELPEDTFEHWMSRFVIPITIDQRYDATDLEYVHTVIERGLK